MSVCKKHVIPAASWLLHMDPVICFEVIWNFIQGSMCVWSWVDSWAGLFYILGSLSMLLQDKPQHNHEICFGLYGSFLHPSPFVFHRLFPSPLMSLSPTTKPLIFSPSHFLLVRHTLHRCLKIEPFSSISHFPSSFVSGWLGEGDLAKETHKNRHGDSIQLGDANGERGEGVTGKDNSNGTAIVWRQLHHRAYFLQLPIHGPMAGLDCFNIASLCISFSLSLRLFLSWT